MRLAPLDDLERLVPLMRAAFDIPIAERHFAWKYRENPSGDAIAFEAVGPDGPVAFYCAIPETYLVGGKRIRVYQPCDVMTEPAYRGHGLYPVLANRTYEHILAQDGRCTTVAFPNEKVSLIATERLGWSLLHTIPLVFLPRMVHRVTRRPPRGVTFTAADDARDLAPYLSARARPKEGVSVDLSPEFLQWRGFDHPYSPARACLAWRASEPVGMCLYSEEPKSRCLIRLAEFASPELYGESFGALADHLFEATGASWLYTWEPVARDRSTVLRRACFIKSPFGRGPGSSRYFFIARSRPREVNGEDWLRANFDVQPIMHD